MSSNDAAGTRLPTNAGSITQKRFCFDYLLGTRQRVLTSGFNIFSPILVIHTCQEAGCGYIGYCLSVCLYGYGFLR